MEEDIYIPNIVATGHFRRDVEEALSDVEIYRSRPDSDDAAAEDDENRKIERLFFRQKARDSKISERVGFLEERLIKAIREGIKKLVSKSDDPFGNHFGMISDIVLLGSMVDEEKGEWLGFDWQSSILFFAVPQYIPLTIQKEEGSRALYEHLETAWTWLVDRDQELKDIAAGEKPVRDHLDPVVRSITTLRRLNEEWKFNLENGLGKESPFRAELKAEIEALAKRLQGLGKKG